MAFMDESVWRGKIYSGGWVGGDLGTGRDAPVIEPATGQEIGRTGIATPADVARAAQIAAAVQPAWAATPHTERSAILRRAADLWLAHAADIEWWGIRESGKIPVAPVVRFSTADDAAKLAAESEYGLSLGILTRDVMRGLDLARRIPTGIVHINEQTVDDEPNIPFGGIGASGTGARFGGPANLEAFTDTHWVTIRGDIAPYPF